MKNIMGLYAWAKQYNKPINRVLLVALLIFDVYLGMAIYRPDELTRALNSWEKNITKVATRVTIPNPTPNIMIADGDSPATPKLPSVAPKNSATPVPSSSTTPTQTSNPTSSNTPANSANPSSTPTPTPAPTTLATPTPTPTATPIPTPTPTPTPTATPAQNLSSSVYITGWIYANNQQIKAEQNPVKVINSQNNETIATGETGNDGKSPTWQIPANTPITIILYPKSGMLGCGESWSFTTQGNGNLETHDLSIQSGRTPCITL